MRLVRSSMLVICVLALAGCEATVMGSNPEGIWFREPFVGGGAMRAQADRHCAKYGKAAVYKGTLEPTQYALPVVAYDCG
jgi:hypothetical protein